VQEEGTVTSFELSPGIVIDRDRGEAYAMSPDGGILALDLARGEPVWRSEDAAKPLAVAGELLAGQAETAGPDNELVIVALDQRDGATVARSLVALPPGVQPSIYQSPHRSFTARAEPAAGGATVSWDFMERPLRGMASGPLEVLPGEEAPPGRSAEGVPSVLTANPLPRRSSRMVRRT
jgi:hypothetical protein